MRAPRPVLAAATGLAFAGLVTVAATSQATGQYRPLSFRQTPVSDASSYTEPSVLVDKQGRILVCAPGGPGNEYWYSSDDGRNFGHSTSAGGGGDCEIDVLPDGSMVSADLEVTDSVIHRSTDHGRTWTLQKPAGIEQDRQWLAHDRAGVVYLVFHDFAAEVEMVVNSHDGGRTWSTPEVVNSPTQVAGIPGVAAKPGDQPSSADQDANTNSGPMLIDQRTGDQYVVYSISDAQSNATSVAGFGKMRGIVVAHKAPQGGPLWDNRYAVVSGSTGLGGDVNAAIFPWGTIDKAGNIYVLFNSSAGGSFHTYYVWSKDKGLSWSAPIRVDGNAVGATVYVTGAAGAPGVLDVAWLSATTAKSPDDLNARWLVDFAQVRNAASDYPHISRAHVSDHIIHHGSICQKGILCGIGSATDDRSLGDFFELAIGPDGMAQVVWSDNGDVAGAKAKGRHVWWAKQQGGLSALQ